MPSLRLLDTNVWIALAKKEPVVVEALRRLHPSEVVTCDVVRAELMYGARKSQRVEQNVAGFDLMLEPFVSLPFDNKAAGQYGLLRVTLERNGTPIGANDFLIAAIALAHDCVLVTRNSREFRRVPGLRIEDWT